ncbi:DEAD/DEAH box helicase [Paraburkholderia susongensis]|uniref:ATP-dependent helicase Lhr and Lhr-like helicase n=1 Tax=Paraburkholderia susongensis TaxID=1515439 RepID=A0A1X7K260_9BURK|nr:DEAD/DEAH box helicase [Paraburkholderia susongensis]SMG34746.1 ATP-dependent helicase Lhr and Lhr-like helicase [Paraburkholderia susongensis]
MTAFERLHPAVQYHVVNSLGWSTLRPTQLQAIDPVHSGHHCLLLAPTAGGKTEAAIIPVLSRMTTEEWRGLSVLYVCPIKALLNNLEPRLARYAALLGRTVEVWHGDVSDSRKRRVLREPPDILLTTPESLEGMLISPRLERKSWFGNVRTVIADELHAIAADDRGWHLRSVLARIDEYTSLPIQRIGLSATVSNPEDILAWFAPSGNRSVVGSSTVSTDADVTIDAVGNLENAAIVVSRMYRGEKRLVFCDSRSSAEKLGASLNRLGVRTFVSHASLSASERRHAEAAFAEERDCVIVATSTLELGIDVGDLDRVIQIDSPASVGSFLQRMGRSGRRAGSRRSCLFLTTSDQGLLTALGVCQLWSMGWVEAASPPPEPWNVVAQQTLLLVLEMGQVPRRSLRDTLLRSFPELVPLDIERLIDGLAASQYLFVDPDDVAQIGPAAERAFGASHYRDLMATFSGPELLSARHGSTELGFLDPSVFAAQEGPHFVLLSGRSWKVKEIDWKKRVVWLEPAKEGGKARWTGGGREFGAELAQAIRVVLENGTVKYATLSKRATAALEDLRNATPVTAGAVQAVAAARFKLWTFAGTLANRTRMLREAARGAYRFNGLSIDYRRDPRIKPEIPLPECIDDNALMELVKLIKFNEMLPPDLALRIARRRRLVAAE